MSEIVEVELDIDAVRQIHLESGHPMCHLLYIKEEELSNNNNDTCELELC